MKEILMIGIPAIIGLVIGALAGFFVRKKISEAKIGSAEDQAKKIVEEGEKTAETLKKEALIEAKEKDPARQGGIRKRDQGTPQRGHKA